MTAAGVETINTVGVALELSCQVAAFLVRAVGIGTLVYFEAVEVGAVGVSAMVPVGDGAVVVAAGDLWQRVVIGSSARSCYGWSLEQWVL